MVSLRFPFLFSPSPLRPFRPPQRLFSAAAAAAVAAGVSACVALSSQKNKTREHPFLHDALNFFISNIAPQNRPSPIWGSLSLGGNNPSSVVESKTGASFPSVLSESRRLLGIGLRKRSVLGLKKIDVYAFGVYVVEDDVQKVLGEKYGKQSLSELKGSTEFCEDIMGGDIGITVRLQIVYSRLSIQSVRSAFEDSVGSRLLKFGGSDDKELLQRFTSQFKDEYKIPQGSVIELSRGQGHVLITRIDGKEVGSIQSQLLCRSILDLYMGEDPFDRQAKDNIQLKLASLLQD